MTQSPTPKALSTFLKHNVKALLIGGQACILYGAAEFSRDIDLMIMISPENLEDLTLALEELKAERDFYPYLSEDALLRGHACHFRCQRTDIKGLRIDVIGVMRGVDSFPELWERREEIELPDNIHGGGGTDFCPAFEWISTRDQRPDLVVYFTDALGSFPDREPDCPVIWLVKGKTKVPWDKESS